MVPKICSVDGCDTYETVRVRRGMCQAHYAKWVRRNPPEKRPARPTAEERFWSKVDKSGPCWVWLAGKMTDGYGSFTQGRAKKSPAHRVAWEWLVGPIPEGLFIDHMCHNKACVNPDHLQVVTYKLNSENLAGAQKRNPSGVRGVHIRPSGKWHAKVSHYGTVYNLGTFDTIEDAEAVVVAKRNELYTNNLLDRQGRRAA